MKERKDFIMKKVLCIIVAFVLTLPIYFLFVGCSEAISGTKQDTQNTIENANKMQMNQPTAMIL